MPKQQINYPEAERVFTGSMQDGVLVQESSELNWDPFLVVHWGKHGGNPDEPGSVSVSIDQVPSMSGDDYLESGADPKPIQKASTRGLTRSDLNRMIATLRKARDEAFGRDE